MSGRFKWVCATALKHDEWNCEGTKRVAVSKITKAQTEALLSYINQTLPSRPRPPNFCTDCLDILRELQPHLFTPRQPERSVSSTSNVPGPSHGVSKSDSSAGQYSAKWQELHHSSVSATEGQQMGYIDSSTQTDFVYIIPSDMKDISQDILNEVLHKFGEMISDQIRLDTAQLAQYGNDIQSLANLDINSYISHQNPGLLSFLLGVSNRNISEIIPSGSVIRDDLPSESSAFKNNKKNYILCKTVESILNLTGLNMVFPLHLGESVFINTVGSTTLTLQLMSNSSPAGSYKTVHKWLSKLATTSEMGLTGDVIAVFDNNQTMQRRWNVQVANKVFVHVVTIVAYFQIDANGGVQCRTDLKPGLWLLRTLEPRTIKNLQYIDQDPAEKLLVYEEHLYPHWTHIIIDVAQEQTNHGKDGEFEFRDPVDEHVKAQRDEREFKQCYDCGTTEIPLSKINCTHCNTNLNQVNNAT